MRLYATVCPGFWTGSTGRAISRAALTDPKGADTQRVALYLMTNPHANMIGFYYLPNLYLCQEVGITEEGVGEALAALERLDFAFRDPETLYVWVKEMARFQIGESLKAGDGRVKMIARQYQAIPLNPLLAPFFARYSEAYHITTARWPIGDSARTPPVGGPLGGGIKAPPTPPTSVLFGSGLLTPAVAGPRADGVVSQKTPDPDPDPESEDLVNSVDNRTADHATPIWLVQGWNQIPGILKFDGKLEGTILAKIQTQLKEKKTKNWWIKYLNEVRKADWLCGRNDKQWAATLLWALGPVNQGKVLAGAYQNRQAGSAPMVNGSAPKPKCNYYPDDRCQMPVSSTMGSERHCGWHNHLSKHPELHDGPEEFTRYWSRVNPLIKKNVTAEEAWRMTNPARQEAP